MTDDIKYERGRKATVNGFAHEHVAVGILMKRYGDVSLVDLPISKYDLIIVKEVEGGEEYIRGQVKTATKSISFKGGSRGGVDREYISDEKVYTYTPETCDVVICVHPSGETFDLYFVPTILVVELNQGSISINRVHDLKNNYDILENCKDRDYVISKCIEFGILRQLSI